MQLVTSKVQRISADDWHMLEVIGKATDRSSRKDVLTAVIKFYCAEHGIQYKSKKGRK